MQYTDSMRLVTRVEAAKLLHVSEGMIQYWLGIGALEKHPRPRQLNGPRAEYMLNYLGPNCNRNVYIDLHAAELLIPKNAIEKLKRDHPAANLLTVSETAKLTNRTVRTIEAYVKQFGLKKYKLHSKSSHYLINGEELADRLEERGLPLVQ